MVEGEGAEDGIVLEETRAGIVDQDGDILRYIYIYRFLTMQCCLIYLTYLCVYKQASSSGSKQGSSPGTGTN